MNLAVLAFLVIGNVTPITGRASTIDNGWSQYHGGNSFAGAASNGPDLRVYTTPRFQVGSGLGAYFGPNVSSPIVMNNRIFAYSQSGAVSAFSEFDGSSLWSTPIEAGSFGSWASPSADVASNSVYMGSGSHVYRLNAETGEQLWSFQLTEYGGTGETYAQVVNAAPTIVPGVGLNGEGLVYQHTYGSFGGGTRLHAINVADGSLAWYHDTPGQGQGEVAYNPSNGLIYAVTNGDGNWADGRGGIVALDAATGAVAWESADSYFAFSFGGIAYDAANNRVVAGGYSFYSYAGMLVVDGDTGETISYTGDDVAPSGDYRPTIGDDNLIYVTGAEFQDGPYIYAFDALTGEQVWRVGESFVDPWGGWTHSLTYAQDIGDGTDVVYAADQTYYVSNASRYGMFDADTGELLKVLDFGGGPGALANGNLYVLTNEGQLVAFGPAIPEPGTLVLCAIGSIVFAFKRRRKEVPALVVAVAAALSQRAATHAQNPYATELVAENGAYGGASLYNDPLAVLGEPTRVALNNDPLIGTSPFHIKIVEPAYNRDLAGNKVITTLARSPDGAGGFIYGSITIKFDHPVVDDPVNPYGIDLNVFGNAFYVGSGFVHDTTDLRSYDLVGGIFAEPVVISVSPDNLNWYTYETGPYGDTAFPTQGHVWSGEQHDLTGDGWTTAITDFTKPVNPTLDSLLGAPGQNMSATDAIGAYVGSGGGTGIDLAESGFASIQFVRVESTAAFRDGEIDAFSDVRPMVVGDALSITPQNVFDGTSLYFQQPEYESHTAACAEFTSINDPAKFSTGEVTDEIALAALPEGELLATYQLDVERLFGSGPLSFQANYLLSAGMNYQGSGADVNVLAWDGEAWNSVAFTFDASSGLARLANWTVAVATLALVSEETSLPGDFNRDGSVDAADYTVWRNGLDVEYDQEDYQLWKGNFGKFRSGSASTGAVASVPEPATSMLVAVGCAAGTILRRRTTSRGL